MRVLTGLWQCCWMKLMRWRGSRPPSRISMPPLGLTVLMWLLLPNLGVMVGELLLLIQRCRSR